MDASRLQAERRPGCRPGPHPKDIKMSQDRREQIRLPVEICVQQYLTQGSCLGLTRDLSERGLYLTAPRLRDDQALLGAPLQLEFALPGTGETVWARGHVRYENMDGTLKGLGISLTEMAQTHAQSLRAYLETIRKARLHNMLLRIQKPQQFSTGRLPGVILPS